MKSYVLLIIIFLSGCAGPVILGEKMKKNVVCPSADTNKCVQSIVDGPRYYVENPARYIEVDENGKPNYTKFLGRKLTSDVSPVALFCGGEFEKNPLEEHTQGKGATLVQDPAVTSNFTFTRRVESKLNAGTAIDVDTLLNSIGVPTSIDTSQVEIEINAAWDRLKRSEIIFNGVYRFVHLNPTTIGKLTSLNPPPELEKCAKYLREHDESIIVSITGVYITTGESKGSFVNKAGAGLKASLEGKINETEIARIVAAFENSVNDSYTVTFEPVFQVLSAAGFNNYKGK